MAAAICMSLIKISLYIKIYQTTKSVLSASISHMDDLLKRVSGDQLPEYSQVQDELVRDL